MINGGWDIIVVVLIVGSRLPDLLLLLTFLQAVYWVETKGKTLEEIDALFEGKKHSNVPDVELVRSGKETLDVAGVEKELATESIVMKSE